MVCRVGPRRSFKHAFVLNRLSKRRTMLVNRSQWHIDSVRQLTVDQQNKKMQWQSTQPFKTTQAPKYSVTRRRGETAVRRSFSRKKTSDRR
ncbi:hypothetical protein Y032_0145g2479 [Ancylostoma ceylanicum]|uniref:Uncharacterized protein n=1 Tax=Ancylostoma ceylanicum TaxID=53326 RepID=A0A016T2J7_9BILA|nr:hypothetical protein Y032_0145g2479 [Ancylostoma ceylanicum]